MITCNVVLCGKLTILILFPFKTILFYVLIQVVFILSFFFWVHFCNCVHIPMSIVMESLFKCMVKGLFQDRTSYILSLIILKFIVLMAQLYFTQKTKKDLAARNILRPNIFWSGIRSKNEKQSLNIST